VVALRPIVLVVGLILTACATPGTADPAIAQAGRRAMEAEMTALVSPAGSPCPPDAATWTVVQAQARERITAAFADPAKTRLLDLLLRDTNRQACTLAGGVDSYSPGSTSVHGGSASLQARVGIWSRFRAVGQPGTPEPHNVEDCEFQLIRPTGGWVVSDFSCKFVPGHGP